MKTLISDLYFKPVTTNKELKACYSMRYKVYCEEKKWLPSFHYPNELETDSYDDKATHLIAMDEDFNIVGSVRLLLASKYEKLPYQDHPVVKRKNIQIPHNLEISRFIVTAAKNRYQVARGLYRAVYQVSKQEGAKNWVILVENSFIRYVEKFLFFWKPICTAAKYFGGITVPASCNIMKTEQIWAEKYPEAYEFNTADYTTYSDSKVLVA